MPHVARSCLLIAAAMLAASRAAAEQLPVELSPIQKIADNYAQAIAQKRKPSSDASWVALQKAKTAGETGNWKDAVQHLEVAAGAAPRAAPVFLRLAGAWDKADSSDKRGQAAALLAYKQAQTDGERLEALIMLDASMRVEAGALRDQIAGASKRLSDIAHKLGRLDEKTEKAERAALTKERLPILQSRLDHALKYSRLVDTNQKVVTLITKLIGNGKSWKERDALAANSPKVFYILDRTPNASAGAGQEEQERGTTDSSAVDESDDKPEKYTAPIKWTTSGRALRACVLFSLALRPSAAFYKSRHLEVREKSGDGTTSSVAAFDVNVRGQELCFIGLKHEVTYEFVFKRGMPDQTGFVLAEDTSISGSAPKAQSFVRFNSRAYVMPTNAAGTVAVTLVRAPVVRLGLYRVGDRSVYREAIYRTIGTNFVGDVRDFKQNRGEKLWSGILEVGSEPTNRVSIDVPVAGILEARRRWLRSLPDDAAMSSLDDPEARIGGIFTDGRFYGSRGSYQSRDATPNDSGLYVLLVDNLPDYENSSAVAAYRILDPNIAESAADGTKEPEAPAGVQWIVVTDIGLTYYRRGTSAVVIARSLMTGEAIPNAEIHLVSAGNRVLGKANTNTFGVAELPAGLTRGQQGNRLASIFAYHDADFSIIDPNRDVFDLSAHGLEGRSSPRMVDTYIYTDRGLYRPGESINAVVLVRDTDGKPLTASLPITIRLRGAKGQALSDEVQFKAEDLAMGGVALKLPIARTALLGAADIEAVVSGQVVGRVTLQIGHFQPDRARIQLSPPAEKIASEDAGVQIHGLSQANYLYGGRSWASTFLEAPASHLLGEMRLLISPSTSPFESCYGNYAFGDIEQSFPPFMTRHSVGPTGENGRLAYDIALPDIPRSNLPLKANVSLSLFDVAGRIGSRSQQFVLKRDIDWIGVRIESRDANIGGGLMRTRFNIMTLDRHNKPRRPDLVTVEISREVLRYHWYESGGRWRFIANTEKVAERTLQIPAVESSSDQSDCREDTHRIEHDLPVGNYTITVRDSAGVHTTTRFVVGASTTGARALPEVLPIRGYRTEYNVGETVDLKVEGQFNGHLLVAVVINDRIVDWIASPAPQGQAEIKLPVPRIWTGQQVHLLATLFRSGADGSLQQGPARAIGIHRFRVVEPQELLDVDLEGTPRKLASGAELPVMVTLRRADGSPFNGTAMVSLFAVDEGIINLTDHKVAEPGAHFFGPKKMALEVLDNYGRLILNDRPAQRSGGDEVTGFLSRVLGENVRADRLFSRMHFQAKGVLFQNGIARINPGWGNFPNFDGAMRVVALVWTDQSVGAASTHVLVRSALVASLGAPRYVAPGDRLKVPLTIENLEAVEGTYKLRLSGPHISNVTDAAGQSVVDADKEAFDVDLSHGQRKLFWAHLSVPQQASVGQLRYELHWQLSSATISLPEASKAFSINIHEPSPPSTILVGSRRLKPGEQMAFGSDLLPRAVSLRIKQPRVQVRIGKTPTLLAATTRFTPPSDVIGSLESLIWSGMTLLAAPDELGSEEVNLIVQDISSLQNQRGTFDEYTVEQRSTDGATEVQTVEAKPKDGRPSGQELSREIWRTALVTDFLTRYRSRSVDVDVRLSRALGALQKEFVQALSADRLERSTTSCTVPYLYAAIVLATENRVTDGDLARHRETCPSEGMGSLESAMLAAATVAFGRVDTANILLASIPSKISSDAPTSLEQSSQQRSAMLLAFLARAGAPDSMLETALQSFVLRAQGEGDVLSAAAIAWLAQTSTTSKQPSSSEGSNIRIEVNGEMGAVENIVELRSDDEFRTKFINPRLPALGNLTVTNRSAGPVVATIFARGSDGRAGDAATADLHVKRSFLDEQGRPLDIETTHFAQNKLYYVLLEGRAKPADASQPLIKEVVVSDYLPAGFEVAAKSILPGAMDRSSLKAAFGDTIGRTRYAEALDDRFVTIVEPSKEEGTFRLLYAVRPTLIGELSLPVTTLEDLRRPELQFATKGGGRLIKVEAEPQ